MTGLGILAGGGTLPIAIAESLIARGRDVHIVGIKGEADASIERFSHTWVAWGQIGAILGAFSAHNCPEMVIIGAVRRPNLRSVRLDLGSLRNLPLILSMTVGGDDAILSRIVRFFEAKGLIVRGAHEVAPNLLVPSGPLGRHLPNEDANRDIARGLEVVRALGALDVGQAAVVARGYVLAVEAAEGTDAMLERARGLRQWGANSSKRRQGVLVKRPKPGQELRVDLPVIGPKTVRLAADAGLAGIAVQARHVMLADCAELMRIADSEGLFVTGVDDVS